MGKLCATVKYNGTADVHLPVKGFGTMVRRDVQDLLTHRNNYEAMT